MSVTLRPAMPDDVGAAARFLNERALLLTGSPDLSETELRTFWTTPGLVLEQDVVLAVDAEGAVVGYGDFQDETRDGSVLWLDVRGDEPGPILDLLERRVAETGAPGGVVRTFTYPGDEVVREALSARGFEVVRRSYRMEIELDGPPRPAAWPPGVSVREAPGEAELPLLHRLQLESFADHWGFHPTPYEEWAHWQREGGAADPSLRFVAEEESDPVGVLLCHAHGQGDPELGWVGVLGVLRPWRGRGIGSALLAHAFAVFHARGYRRVGLGVDAENTTGAVRLYERAGMRVAHAYEIWERPL